MKIDQFIWVILQYLKLFINKI